MGSSRQQCHAIAAALVALHCRLISRWEDNLIATTTTADRHVHLNTNLSNDYEVRDTSSCSACSCSARERIASAEGATAACS
eukprot:18736-Heterococcus_DN1.PRE.7